MPKEKGRLGHAAVRIDSDVGLKYQKIGSLIPVVEHLRRSLDSQPEYFGLSRYLDDAQDDLVNHILESPVDSPTRISVLFEATMRAPAEDHEMSMSNYKGWTTPEPVKVRKIELTRGLVAVIDDADYEMVSEFNWIASLNRSPVAQRRIQGEGRGYTTQSLHDFLMSPPEGVKVEHINGDLLDNRRVNLMFVQSDDVPIEP